MSAGISTPPTANRFLAALTDRELAALQPHLQWEEVPPARMLQQPGRPVDTIRFPVSGLVSLVVDAPGQAPIETTLVGREGVTNALALLTGDRIARVGAVTPLPGAMLAIDWEHFAPVVQRSARLRGLLSRYVNFLFGRLSWTVVCCRYHSTEQRLARWFLDASDNADSDRFSLSHQSLARMMGTRRATISEAAGALRLAGIIEYRRGNVRIADRGALESAACACYPAVRAEVEALYRT
jgi:CRP-like cAMP-binding protein